ncbi:MAG TPA: hypothetical protein VKB25_03700 [Conexibacter sp.]|nr:hypothetical protein [Conexibacter sp.]
MIVIAPEIAMGPRSKHLSSTLVDRYLQARRVLFAGAPDRGWKQVQQRPSDKRAIEAVARTIRGGKT